MSTPDADARAADIAERWPDTADATDSLVLMLLRAERRMDRAAERQDWGAADTWEVRRNEHANTIRADIAFLLAERERLVAERDAAEVETARLRAAITDAVPPDVYAE